MMADFIAQAGASEVLGKGSNPKRMGAFVAVKEAQVLIQIS